MSSIESADGRVDERAAGDDRSGAGGQAGDKPEWGLVLVLFAPASLALRYGGVWNWWALLWAPLYVAALGVAAVDWQLLVRCRWRMPVKEWVLFGLTHVSALSSLAILAGLLSV
ncbi:hypothetical protein [Streptomyces sp. NPDC048442]|uniref:hypothetical protein n=1 Tax=Streptomyces sp. NPDC048442 TaxID=3154823 RepID=UPI003444C5A4